MNYNYVLFILLLSSIPQSLCLNALFVSLGLAGHVTPMFELCKSMKNHNVTFLTQQLAQSYIDFKLYSSPLFRVVYNNDSSDALSMEKNEEQQIGFYLSNSSVFDAMSDVMPIFHRIASSLLNRTIHVLMSERFDVIVASQMINGIPVLCKETNTPCVLQSPSAAHSIVDLNIPNIFSLITAQDLTQLGYRIYNAAFTIRVMAKSIPTFVPMLYKFLYSTPQVPGPFQDSFTVRNILFSRSKCLNLISMPPSFYTVSYPDYYTKYLGVYINETQINNIDNDLTRWIISKPFNSIVYGAFGSLALISYERMYSLINGLGMFLLQVNDSSILLAFRNINYATYQTVLKDLTNEDLRNVLNDDTRVRIEKGIVDQKWILRHDSVKIFLSHCGMGSCLESLYFAKPILCMPFGIDQFANAITIENLNAGESLFVPYSIWQSLLNPGTFHQYTFSANSVTDKLFALWTNTKYEKVVRLMSLEMKHAGGLRRAVEEIEFFVNLNGDLDRFIPFQSTLPFYQRYMLDLLFIFFIIPATIIVYMTCKCCKRRRQRKQKKD